MEDLPVHVMVDILSRLPVKTIIHCKCVCKKWLDLVSDSYFTNIHLLRSPACIMIHHNSEKEMNGYPKPGILKWVEIEDELDHHHLHHNPVMSLDLNLAPPFQDSQILSGGSVDGLICLWQSYPKSDITYICNPISREYMILPRQQYDREGDVTIVYGFRVDSVTKEYKVIRTLQGNRPPNPTSSSQPTLLETEVYTVGTGKWRSLGHIPYWLNNFNRIFLHGHAHWDLLDQDYPEFLCAFDFDKETFKLFPSPPIEVIGESRTHFGSLAVLKGCLCQSETFDSEFRIWVMMEYGLKKSWHKEVIIKQGINPELDWFMWAPVYLIKALEDGTILMVYHQDKLLAYCPQRRTIVDTTIFDLFFKGFAYRPSFHKLQNFEQEIVHVFRRSKYFFMNTHGHFYFKLSFSVQYVPLHLSLFSDFLRVSK